MRADYVNPEGESWVVPADGKGIGINSGMRTELSAGSQGERTQRTPLVVLRSGFQYVDRCLVALTLSFCPSESEHMPLHKAISAAAMCI